MIPAMNGGNSVLRRDRRLRQGSQGVIRANLPHVAVKDSIGMNVDKVSLSVVPPRTAHKRRDSPLGHWRRQLHRDRHAGFRIEFLFRNRHAI
jgi:hypothetical protein